MKNSVIKILILFIIMILIIGLPYSQADDVTIPSIMDPDITDDVNPEVSAETGIAAEVARPFTELISEVVQNLLGAIQVIGGLLTIISVAVYGLMMLLYSQPKLMGDLGIDNKNFGGYDPNVRKKLLDYIRQLIIGSALLFSSSSIVVFVMGILLN